jgi:ABC-type multidrug transport system fused ATPase/permease subunit
VAGDALRSILAEFGVSFDDTELKKGDAAVTGLKDKIATVGKFIAGAFAFTAIKNFTTHVLDEADALGKAAQALGTTTRELEELDHAAEMSNVSVETFRGALARLQKGAAEAAEKGSGPVHDAFKKLSVPLKDASGQAKTTGALFTDAAAAIAAIKNPTERAGAAAALFGKNYAPLLPLILEGKDGIAKLRAEVEELGFGFDEAFIENADQFNDNIDRLKKGLRGLGIQAINLLLPKMVDLSRRAVNVTKNFLHWQKGTNLLKSVMAAVTLKGGLMISKWLGPLGAAIRTVSAAFLRFALRIALPILLIDELITTFQGGDTLIRRFTDSLFGVGATEGVVKELKAIWDDFVDVVLPEVGPTVRAAMKDLEKYVDEAIGYAKEDFEALRQLAHDVWESLPGPLKDVLAAIGGMFSDAFNFIGNKIDELLNKFFPLKELFDIVDSKANKEARERRVQQDAIDAANSGGEPKRRGITEVQHIARGLAQVPGVASAPATAVARASATGGGNNMQNTNHVTVNVPPGTPHTMAERTAAATGRAVRNTTKAQFNALVPRAP